MEVASFEKAYEMLNDETLNVTSFDSDTIKGTYTASQKSVLYTSIFYEEGWTAKVDGKKVEIKPIQDALISIDIPSGTHTVEFSYIPQGFIPGLIISIISLLFMIFLIVMGILKKRVSLCSFKTQATNH